MTKREDLDVTELTGYLKKLLKTLSSWRGMSRHHVFPKERGGKKGKGNIKHIPGKFHCLLHLFFGNMTVEEMKYFLEFWLKGNKKFWKEKEILTLQDLILNRKIVEAMNLSQYGTRQQEKIIEVIVGEVESRKIKKLKRRISELEASLELSNRKGE